MTAAVKQSLALQHLIRASCLLLCGLLCVMLPMKASAQDFSKEMDVLANVQKYLRGIKPNADNDAHINIGIVFDAKVPASQTQAQAVYESMVKSAMAQQSGLKAVFVDIGDAQARSAQQWGDLQLLYVVEHLSHAHERIYGMARTMNLFTISHDMRCVQAQCAILGIDIDTSVSIFLNEGTMRSLGFGVDANFLFVVKRL